MSKLTFYCFTSTSHPLPPSWRGGEPDRWCEGALGMGPGWWSLGTLLVSHFLCLFGEKHI